MNKCKLKDQHYLEEIAEHQLEIEENVKQIVAQDLSLQDKKLTKYDKIRK